MRLVDKNHIYRLFTRGIRGIVMVKPILMDFYADWCGPCKIQDPILEKLENKFGDKIEFKKINVDDNLPSTLIFLNSILSPNLFSSFSNIGSCICLLYTSPSPRDGLLSRMPSSA